jgi:4-hydroxythreonine-4-phosphate dehydrogenase
VKPLAITLGDPAGIGTEVVLKAIAGLDLPVRLFGSRAVAQKNGSIPKHVGFFDVGGGNTVRPGEVSAEAGRIALASIDAAVTAIEHGDCIALVTAPIHKQAIAAAGARVPGHTEMLAQRAGLRRYAWDYAMYFDSPEIRTALLSVHVSLRDAIDRVNADDVAALARLMDREHLRLYGKRPRMAAAGINPHAGEGGRFGSEERAIAEGVHAAKRDGISIEGPFAADTLFRAARQGKYDVVLAMYHDQGLIPVKTLAFESSVNVTIGLPYLRCSVDHGTAFDIAGKGMADATPMRYAIEWAAKHAERFRT